MYTTVIIVKFMGIELVGFVFTKSMICVCNIYERKETEMTYKNEIICSFLLRTRNATNISRKSTYDSYKARFT